MQTYPQSLKGITTLACVGIAFAFSGARAPAADATEQADAFPTFESYIKISGQAPWVSGDGAAFQKGTNTPTAGSGGIEDMFYTKDLTDNTTIEFKGKALGGSENYLADLNLTTANVGSVDVGYKRFRTFYDGVGGFFPLNDQFQKASPERLAVDRGAFWVDLKLARPDRPVFTLSFHDEIRTGNKDSTEWGLIVNPLATVTNGALVGNATPANTVAISPNIQALAEHHKILDGSMVATIGKTTETFKVTLDWVNNLDTRYYQKYPNSTVIADPSVMVLDDQEGVQAKSFHVLNQTETKFTDKIALDVGLCYFHVTSTDGGEWITPAYNATANAIFNAVTAGNIYANAKVDDFAGNVALKFTPTPNWLAEVGFKEETNIVTDAGGFITTSLATGATTTAATNVTTAQDLTYSHEADHIASPEASLQYLGLKNISIYTSFDDRVNRGNQHWINPYAAVTTTGTGVVTTAGAAPGSVFFQDDDQDNRNAKFGINWNACSFFTLRTEVYRKDHVNRFIGANDIIGTGSYGALYATGYTFTGAAISLIVHLTPTLSFNSRFQPQSGNMAVTANTVTGGLGTESTSGKARGDILSETVNWSPSTQVYLQGSANLVYNYIQTAYPVVVVSTTTAIPTPIQNSNNNYVVCTGLCGFVLNKTTDIQVENLWERANNYNPQIALGGNPYGAGFETDRATVGLKHKFSERLFGEGKLGYIKATSATTGNFTNYKGPLAYVSLTYSL